MTNAEHLFEEQLILRQTAEIGDKDGTYEKLTEDPGSSSKTVFVSKSRNTKAPFSSTEKIIFVN